MNDPRELLATSRMSRLQIIVIAITVGLNALDGFDVLAISFASPGIAREWGIDRAALGIVLSMELLGMGLGSVFLGSVADKLGRRRTMLGCLLVITLGMAMATQVRSVQSLSIWRVITGLGIGGMLATNNALAAEFSNARRRALCVSLMAIGYPIGAVIGGSIAAELLKLADWRGVFYFGAIVSVAFIPLVFFLVPESIGWLCQQRPPGALATLNRVLARMGHATLNALPDLDEATTKRSAAEIFGPRFLRITLLMSAAYFLHVTSFYFIVKWVPKIVVDLGFTPSSAAGVLVWVNIGGATGGAVLGLLSLRVGLKILTIATLAMSTVMLAVFGHVKADLSHLALVCAISGFFTNAGIVGLYGILAQVFPTHLRATGTGFAVGTGRAGSFLAPIIAGFLFSAGYPLTTVAVAMGVGSLVAAIAVAILPFKLEAPPRVGASGAN